MREDQIPQFVDEIIAAGCPICAVGHTMYVIGEIDVPDQDFHRVAKDVRKICEQYGERDHLQRVIAAHLRSIGRYVDLEQSALH